jgi:hypothetical protein
VFATRTGKADSRNNVRRRVLIRAIEQANENIALSAEGDPREWEDSSCPSASVHTLRRSFASWLWLRARTPRTSCSNSGVQIRR